jgi:hypothetical protein
MENIDFNGLVRGKTTGNLIFFSTHVFCDGMIVDKLWATATFVNCEWYGEKTYMLKDELGPFKLQQSSLMSRYDDA